MASSPSRRCGLRGDGGARVAALQVAAGRQRKAAGGDGVLDGEDRRAAARIAPRHVAAPALRGFQRLAEHPGDGLAVEHHLGGEERLVVAVGAGVAFAGDVGRGEDGDDAGLGERRGGVERVHAGVGVRREHGPGVQQVRESARARSSV